ncbi:DUF359 domain-containing protein [Candidatus Micrarchaeota archaeon]|nr:DUF359 domain-containing protein [Candidatus Micrarchaeota archaeon]
MLKLPDNLRKELRKPFGKFVKDFSKLKGKKIFAIGDETVLVLLKNNIIPYVSVFDFKIMRKPVTEKQKKTLLSVFKNPLTLRNPAGTISHEALPMVEKMMMNGGAVLVDGEEDLLALLFIYLLKEGVVLYGQPKEGMVMVEPSEKTRKKALSILEKMLHD